MSKKMVKVVSVLLMAVMMISVCGNVFATNLDIFESAIAASDTSGSQSSITNIIGQIIKSAQIIGTGVAIIMLIVLAIKYISAAPSDKAEIKKSAVVYIVGAIVLFAASGILQIIRNFAFNNIK